MPNDWEKVRMGDCISLKGGLSYKSGLIGEGNSILVGMGAVSFSDRFLISGARSYGGEFSENHRLSPGDLVIATRQQSENLPILGFPAMIPTEFEGKDIIVATNLYKVFNHSKIDNNFLYWLLRGTDYRQRILSCAKGTTIRMITKDAIEDFWFSCPPVNERKAITYFLDTLDNKIEFNRQMNETLEAMAQALFKSWFVDFDPAIDNALAAGNKIPDPLRTKAKVRLALGNKRKPLPESIPKLFPDSFEYDDDMGWIPAGWECVPVIDAVKINPRVTLKKGTVAKYVDMKALPTSGFAINTVTDKAYSGGAKFNNGDVLLARITPCLENGKTGVVDFLGNDETGFGSTEFIVLRSTNEIKTPFVACLARDETFRNHCIQSMVGSSGRQRVQNSCFNDFYLCLPKMNRILSAFTEITEGFFQKTTGHKNEINTLTGLRDTLLPKLISGELRIPDAEKIVTEAGL